MSWRDATAQVWLVEQGVRRVTDGIVHTVCPADFLAGARAPDEATFDRIEAHRMQRSAIVTRIFIVVSYLALTFGCDPADGRRSAQSRAFATTVESLGVGADAAMPSVEDANERGLRRSYGSDIMKVHECVSVTDDGIMRGTACPSTVVVFGPYITAPGDANVKFRFDIESESSLSVMSDVLSDGAKQFHGAVEEQQVKPNEKAIVQYRIRLFEAARALETRIGIRADRPANFTITNIALSIE
jgi:hypothetical protein